MIKSKNFFNVLGKVAAGLVLAGTMFLASCGGDEESTSASVSTVQFAAEQQTVSENAGATPLNVVINFDKAAGRNGTITIAITEGANTDYTAHYLTNPNGSSGSIELAVTKGQTSAQFTFTPVNNALLHDDRTVEFTIADVSTGFDIGAKDANTITITDDEGPTRANFAVNASSIAETLTAGQDVTINLTNAAPAAGAITVSFTTTNAAYTTNFTTTPAATAGELEIPVTVGATSVTFKVIPVNDDAVNAARVINFTIAEATGGVEVGTTITTHAFSITDNETPSVLAFDDAEGAVSEGITAGITIPLTLTPTTNSTGTVVVTFTGADYGDDFTTEPAAVGGQITLNVATAAATTSFKVIPVNDAAVTANREITFTLSAPTGVVTLGTSDLTYDLTIQEDDAITSIADVRTAFPGTTTSITSPLRIKGIVTSINPQINGNNITVQDATGGIVVRLLNPNAGAFVRGDEVSVQLMGGRYAEFSGLLQVEQVPNANVTELSQDNTLPTPEVVTITQLKTGNYESRLVSVQNVGFVDADGVLTMNQTRVISDGTNTTNVRTEAAAPFSGSVMPYGIGTVTGLAAENGGAVQIIPMVFAEDVFASSAVGTINVTQSLTDFGSVDNGAESTSQSYTVTGATLVHPIVVSASTGFKVSSNDTDFSASVTLPTTGGTVYVKFAPVSGVNQAIDGVITHRSLGAAVSTFGVDGTETGNAAGAGTLMIYEVYGAGGNSGATYTHDYVVLYNGTSAEINLATYSLQYGSAAFANGFSQANTLSGTIGAGEYFLVQLASGANGVALPVTPDLVISTSPINLSGTAGNVGLFSKTTAHGTAPLAGEATLVDRVGFGATAMGFEGSFAPAPTTTASIRRKTFVDTNNNGNDFEVINPIDLTYLND